MSIVRFATGEVDHVLRLFQEHRHPHLATIREPRGEPPFKTEVMVRIVRIAVLAVALAAVVSPSASALDIVTEQFFPDGVVGLPYSYQVLGEEGCPPSYKFTVLNGVLPDGLTLNLEGKLSGTPTRAGTWGFWLDLDDNCTSINSQAFFTLRVLPALVVATPSLKAPFVGTPYQSTLTAEGGGTLVWSMTSGTLPPGLTLSPDGKISGTPTALGSWGFTARVFDLGTARVGLKEFALPVISPLAVTPPTAPAAEAGRPFTFTPSATGGRTPLVWSILEGTLPSGLAIDSTSGIISGRPTAVGAFPVKLGVADADGSSLTVDLPLTIRSRLTVTTAELGHTKVGGTYRARIRTRGGFRPIRWRIVQGALPPGIKLNRAEGTLTGSARKAGTYRATFEATDALGVKARKALSLLVES